MARSEELSNTEQVTNGISRKSIRWSAVPYLALALWRFGPQHCRFGLKAFGASGLGVGIGAAGLGFELKAGFRTSKLGSGLQRWVWASRMAIGPWVWHLRLKTGI